VTPDPRATPDPRGQSDRLEARKLSQLLISRFPALARVGDVDLGPALEQALFSALRSGTPERPAGSPVPGGPLRWAVPFGRLALTGVPRRAHRNPVATQGGVLALVHAAIHAQLLAPVAEQLARDAGLPVHVVAANALEVPNPGTFASVHQLSHTLDPVWLGPLAGHATRVVTQARHAMADWVDVDPRRGRALRRLAGDALPRLALVAARLVSAIDLLRPSLLVAYDETGIWGRLVPAAAHARSVPALDLPHGEAAGVWGSAGIDYDVVAVYGPRAASVMRAAGIEQARIAEVGAVRYDSLIRELGGTYRTWPDGVERTILLASQPVHAGGDFHTSSSKVAVLRAAVAAAQAVAPATLIIRPHPTERDGVNEDALTELEVPSTVRVEIDRARDLHELLGDTWLMVTAYSQSTFEAAIAGVPTLSINATGSPFAAGLAEEGIALAAVDEVSAAQVSRALLTDEARRAQVARARRGLEVRLGNLDGRATQRTAELIAGLAGHRGFAD
jgi:hypothetical protein